MSKKANVPQNVALYKAFAQIPENVDELNADQMIVDTSGDSFGICPEDAIRNLYQSLPAQRLNRMIEKFFYGATDEEVAVEGDEKELEAPSAGGKLILLKIIPNSPDDLEKGLICGEVGVSCQLDVALSNFEKGVTNCLAEYDIKTTAAWTRDHDVHQVTMLEFNGLRSSHETDQFPEQIKFKVSKTRRDVSYEVFRKK